MKNISPAERSSLKAKVRSELRKKGIRKASLFGSLHSGEFTERSDIDLMIEAGDDMSLLDLARLKRELEEAVGFRIDIITYRSLDPRFKDLFLNNSEELI